MPVSNALSADVLSQFKSFLDNSPAGTTGSAKGSDKPAPTGAGTAAAETSAAGTSAVTATPDPAGAAAAPAGNAMMAAMASLALIAPGGASGDDVEVALAAVEAKMKKTTDDTAKGEIKIDAQRKRDAIAAKQDALEEAKKSQHKAETAHKHLSIWQKMKLAFEFIGAVLTIAAGIVTALTAPLTGGLSGLAGGMMIASGVMMLMMAIDQTMSMAPGKDGKPGEGFIAMTADAITKDMYPNDPDEQKSEAAKWTMGLNIALTAAAAICGVGGAVVNASAEGAAVAETVNEVVDASDGAASGASQAVQTGEDVEAAASDATEFAADADKGASGADKAGDTAQDSRSLARDIAEKVVKNKKAFDRGLKVGEAANNTASSGTDAGVMTYQYQEKSANADATGHQADAKGIEAIENAIDGAIDILMKRLKSQGDAFAQVLSGTMDAMKDQSNSLSHVKFRG